LTRRTTSRHGTCRFVGWQENATNEVSATSASEIHRCSASSKIAFGYSIAVHASSGIAAIALVTAVFIRTVTQNHAFAAIAAAMTSRR